MKRAGVTGGFLVLALAAAGVIAEGRAWPHFRAAGRAIPLVAEAAPGESLANGSVEFSLAGESAVLTLEAADGTVLLRAAAARSNGVHVTVAWGDNLPHHQPYMYTDGPNLEWSLRSRAGARTGNAAAWATNPPVRVRITGAAEGVRLYPYAFTGEEALNAVRLAKGEPMTALAPAAVQCEYRMTIGQLRVTTEALAHFGQLVRADIRMATPHRAPAVQNVGALADVGPDGGALAMLPVGELPVGVYPCVVTWRDQEGTARLTVTQTFERIELPWLGNRLGLSDKVHAPYEPVRVNGDRVSCVLKQFQAGPDGLFRAVRIKDQEILAGPVRLAMEQGGKGVSFAVREAAKPAARSDAEAVWQSRLEGGGLTVRTAVTFEFDGMARYELTLDPGDKPVRVDRLALEIPLKPEHGAYIHALPLGGSFRDYEVTRFLPERDGRVWDSATGFGRGAMKPTAGSFAPMVWLGGLVRGLCFFADNDRGWIPSETEPAITVTRLKGEIRLALNFIAEPAELTGPRTIVFGLMGTPSKPAPPDLRGWSRGDLKRYGPVAGRIASCDSFAPWKTLAREQAFDVFPMSNDWDWAERAAAEMRAGPGGKYPAGQALMLYYDKPWGRSGRDGLHFDWEWKSSGPGQRSAYVYTPSLVDCRVWYLNEYFRRNIYDGIYIDDVFPTANWNTDTGTAYVLDDGRVQPGVTFFGFREFLKRTWNCFHANGKRPIVTIHTTSTFVVPSFAFATTLFDGEDSQRMGNPKYDFVDVWPLERYHVHNIPERTGLVTVYMFKGAYADKYGKDPETQSRLFRGVWMVRLLHDFWQNESINLADADGKRAAGLKLLKRYADTDTQFHPYWDPATPAGVTAVLDQPLPPETLPETWYRSHWSEGYVQALSRNPLRVSLYQNTNALLVVVGNYARVPVKGAVKVDLKKLGLDRRVGEPVDADDWPFAGPDDTAAGRAFTHKGGVFEVTVPARGFRLFEYPVQP